MSPWVATTRPSLVATITPQPVPQNRHGALSHLSSVTDRSVTRFCAPTGAGSPPAATAIAAAFSLRNSRRSTRLGPIATSLLRSMNSVVSGSLEHQRGAQHVRHRRDSIEIRTDPANIRRFDDHHELASGV